MFYSIKAKYLKMTETGRLKKVTEEYLVDGAQTHGEAEDTGYKMGCEYNLASFDVVGVKRSSIKEFVNKEAEMEGRDIYVATTVMLEIDENGNETETSFDVGVYANTVDEATKEVNDYIKTRMGDFVVTSVKKTKILEVLYINK